MNTTYPTIQSLGMSRKLTDNYSYTQDEEKLLKYLFKDYNPNIIPKVSLNESLKLYFGLAMSQLINVVSERRMGSGEWFLGLVISWSSNLVILKYDKEQVMKTNVWIHMVSG